MQATALAIDPSEEAPKEDGAANAEGGRSEEESASDAEAEDSGAEKTGQWRKPHPKWIEQ